MGFNQLHRCLRSKNVFRLFNKSNHDLLSHGRIGARGRNSYSVKIRTPFCPSFKSALNQHVPKSVKLIIGLSGLCGCVTIAVKNCQVAECKTKVIKSRLDHLNNEEVKTESKFDWSGFFKLLVPELGYLLAAVISALAAAIVNIKIPLLLGDLVNIVSNFTHDEARNFIEEIKKPVLKLIGYYSLQGFLTFCYVSLLSTVGENVAARLRKQLFDAYLRQDIEFFDKNKTGELIDRLTSDIQDFKSCFKLCISSGLRASTQTIGCVGTLYTISPKLTGLMVTVIPAIIGVGTFMGSNLRNMSKKAQSQLSKSTAVADEAIGNVRTVRAFAMEQKEYELFGKEVDSSKKLNIQLGVGIGAFQGLTNIALNGIVLGTMFGGGWLIANHEITPGNLMSFLVATQTIERSLAQMSLLFGNVVRGLSAGARVFEFINSTPSVPLTGGKTIPFHSMNGEISFQDVRFSYPTRSEQDVLQDFSLDIPGGKVVALVGLSGGGKSTVASLLERFYEINKGKITIDGEDIKNLDPSWLRGRAIGFINQEPVLFATTVMENIRYGRPDATDIEVLEAADLANAHEFISGFPQGYNTVLGERGVTVSGGQKQRIAIARALIKNPSVLILDEATSALDAESERIVQEALNKVIRGRTVLIIAHRLSTIRDADIIAVVSNGKIVEQGKHDELKKKRGLYWELIKQQEIEEEIEEMRSHFF